MRAPGRGCVPASSWLARGPTGCERLGALPSRAGESGPGCGRGRVRERSVPEREGRPARWARRRRRREAAQCRGRAGGGQGRGRCREPSCPGQWPAEVSCARDLAGAAARDWGRHRAGWGGAGWAGGSRGPGRDQGCCGGGGVARWGWPLAFSRVALFMSRVLRPDLPPNFEQWPGVASRAHTDLLTCPLSGWAVSPALRAPLPSPDPESAVLRDWPRDTPSLNPLLAAPFAARLALSLPGSSRVPPWPWHSGPLEWPMGA